ncbi:unnamed protein product [Adineta steineri]|uniref:Uncharacterized protein n=1 Tax=Adineta steineri TaxID=433720 RepID=A0A814QMS9_9BILA|nr:unnamed protein product [Adineta steineri]CAF1053285.1 unnamed protein product [Adineta steineri]CAF1120516.1 unnamed protein product [Adineta steineri]
MSSLSNQSHNGSSSQADSSSNNDTKEKSSGTDGSTNDNHEESTNKETKKVQRSDYVGSTGLDSNRLSAQGDT